jgi:hypothetical protein
MRAWQETQLLRNGGHPGFVVFWEQLRGHEDHVPAPTHLMITDDDKGWSFIVSWKWREAMDVVPVDYEYAQSWPCSVECHIDAAHTTWVEKTCAWRQWGDVPLNAAIACLKRLHCITGVPWRDSSKHVSTSAMSSVKTVL